MKLNIINFASYLLILMPIFLITGPFLSDLSVIIIDFIFLYLIFKKNEFNYFKNNVFWFLLSFNILISIRSLFAEDILFSLKSSLPYIRFSIFIFAICYFLSLKKELITNFSKVFLIVIILICLDAIFQYLFGFNSLGFTIDNKDKLNGFFGDEAVLGSYLIRLFPLVIVSYLTIFNEKKYTFKFYVLLLLVSFVVFLSGSRSSLVLLIIFLFLISLLFSDLRKKLVLSLIFGILILMSILPFSEKLRHKAYINFYNPIQTMFFPVEIYGVSKSDKKYYVFTPVYDSQYKTALNIFKNYKIFGAGNKMYRKLCDRGDIYVNEYSCTTHPHNFYLQVLAENGLMGFIFILSLFIFVSFKLFKEIYLRNFKKQSNLDTRSLLLITGIFINLWPLVPSGNIFNNWLSILIYFPVGFYLYYQNSKIT